MLRILTCKALNGQCLLFLGVCLRESQDGETTTHRAFRQFRQHPVVGHIGFPLIGMAYEKRDERLRDRGVRVSMRRRFRFDRREGQASGLLRMGVEVREQCFKR